MNLRERYGSETAKDNIIKMPTPQATAPKVLNLSIELVETESNMKLCEMDKMGYLGAFSRCISLIQTYGTPQKDDNYWNELLEVSSKYAEELKGTPAEDFGVSLIMAALKEIDKNSKK